MISIQTNVNSLVAQQNLSVNSMFQSKTIGQLTSGYRINQAGDDAAGLAVANKFRSSIAELTQGVANGNDATAQLQIMDGGMSNISQIMDRLKTLATQSASGTFTGDRSILNSEFQTDLAEIDRQAQSIGLDTGGTFAKNLNIYLGAGSGSQNLSNATAIVNLATASVDTQALGLKGLQAVAGTADLSATSATSVSNIVGNAANKASETTPGNSTFYMTGSGFSDGSKIALSVNLSSVTDTATLATALNAAIGSAGSGTTTAAAAFKAANIVASVNTNANGSQQIAFTSSTQAFQVQAGDQMSNALMGNISTGSTGASLNTTVTGQALTSGDLSSVVTSGKVINLTITGGGMASAQTVSFTSVGGTVSTAITALLGSVTGNTTVSGAGITAQLTSSNQLVFTNSSNQKFNVEASGDTLNQLGLGAYVASGGGTADATSIAGATTYLNTTVAALKSGPQTSLQFSIGGGAAIAIGAISLDAGNATAAIDTTGAVAPSTINAAASNFTFQVDGNSVDVSLAADTSPAITGTAVTPASVDGTHNTITLSVDGTSHSLTLTGSDVTIDNVVTDLQGKIDTAFGGSGLTAKATVSKNLAGTGLVITSNNIGGVAGPSVTIGSGATNDGLATLGFTALQTSTATTTSAASMATQIQTQMNTQLTGTGAAATVTVSNTNQIVITNTALGTDHTVGAITVGTHLSAGTAPIVGSLATALTGGSTTLGLSRTGADLATAISGALSANATLAAAGLNATFSGGTLTISSSNNTGFRVNAGAASAAGTSVGTIDLTNGADFSHAPATLQVQTVNAGTTKNTTVTLNQNYTTAGALQTAIQAQLTAAGAGGAAAAASVVSVNGKSYLTIADTSNGPANTVQVLSTGTANATLGFTNNAVTAGATEANIGLGVSNFSDVGNVGLAQGVSALSVVNASGTTQTGGLTFSGLTAGTGTQGLSISGNNANGVTQSLTVTLAATGAGTTALQNNGTGDNIDNAVAYINSQLQKSNNPTLQSIVAVKQSVGGQEEINFVSPLKGFQVGVGTSTGGLGVNGGAAETATASLTGTASNISIDTQAGAQAAITAIGRAISALGSAQAAVGKGQNQLGYAVSLAQSQITNFSAAESQIRDANVAQQAANLSKAQTLSQASIAAMAQANSAPQAVLSLLRG